MGVEGYRCLSGCWGGGVEVFEWVLVWKGTGVWVGVGVEGYRCVGGCWCGGYRWMGVGVEGTGGWVLVWRDTGEC